MPFVGCLFGSQRAREYKYFTAGSCASKNRSSPYGDTHGRMNTLSGLSFKFYSLGVVSHISNELRPDALYPKDVL